MKEITLTYLYDEGIWAYAEDRTDIPDTIRIACDYVLSVYAETRDGQTWKTEEKIYA